MPLDFPVQPPPDISPAPPGKAARRSWWIAGGLVALAVLSASYLIDRYHRENQASQRKMMIGQMRSLSVSLFEFDAEYGCFPNDATQADVCEATGQTAWPSVTSNDLLKQLIAYGLKTEKVFSDNGLATWTKEADNVFTPFSKALEAGECAFAYVPTSGSHPERPVLLYPLIPGTLTFDPGPLDGEALVLRTDGSIAAMKIEKDERVLKGGKDYFDPSQPMWMEAKPDVRWPAK